MVYCGKPSKACEECRLRRTKCDTKKPSCSQCIRAGRNCKGYRDPGELIFRDESQNLNAKRQRLKELQAQKSGKDVPDAVPMTTDEVAATEDELSWAMRTTTMAPIYSVTLGPSADDQATCFFMQNYVSVNQLSGDIGTFQFLFDIYGSEEVGGSLSNSVASLGMVGLANFWKAPNIIHNSRIKYNSAMKTLATHLRNIEEAKADQTLIATLLLCLYEINACKNQSSMQTATQHIKGATALLQLRGKEQIRTPIGYRVFLYLRQQAITNCILRKTAVPSIFSEWNRELDFEDPDRTASTALAELSIRYCNLRASMASFDDFSEPERIISAAIELNSDFELWAKTSPLQFVYETVTLKERHEEVFSDHYLVYTSVWIASLWNNYRCLRVLLNELIMHQLRYIVGTDVGAYTEWQNPLSIETQLSISKSNLLQLCQDICASVPYFLNFNQNIEAASRDIPKAVNGNYLMWPLYCAGCTEVVSDIMRMWVARRLQWIADNLGIRQAAVLALTLSRQQDLLEWKGEIEEVSDGTSEMAALKISRSKDYLEWTSIPKKYF